MPTSTPIVYADTDVSAPAKNTNTAGRMITILDAILVNGYGSKAAAGWTKPYTGTNIAVYRMATASPATGFYLYVDDSNTSFTTFRGCEVASDAVLANLTNPFPTVAQFAGGAGLFLPRGASGGDWTCVADSRGFYFWCNANAVPLHMIYFGDFYNYGSDVYGCCAIGATASTTAGTNCLLGNNSATIDTVLGGHYMARDTTGALSVNHGKMGLGSTGLNSSLVANYPNPGNSKLLIYPWELNNGATTKGLRGRLPGANAVLHLSASMSNRDTFSQGSDSYILLGCNQTNAYVAVQTNSWTR